jgi:hypothetical protein
MRHCRVCPSLEQVQARPAAEEQADGQEDDQAEGHLQARGRQRRGYGRRQPVSLPILVAKAAFTLKCFWWVFVID